MPKVAQIIGGAVYKSHPDFPGYLIGDDGTVWSCWKRTQHSAVRVSHRVRKLTPGLNGSGYQFVRLKFRGTKQQVIRRVPRLVLETFVGTCPDGFQAMHGDGCIDNNSIANLSWGTPKDNAADRDAHGTTARGSKVGTAKIDESQASRILKLRAEARSLQSIADEFGISKRQVGRIVHGESWRHVINA